jgi:cytochrome P450
VDERYHTWTSLLQFFPKAALMAKSLQGYGILSPLLSLLLIPNEVIFGAKDHWSLCVQKVHQRMHRKTDRKDIMSYILPNDGTADDAILSVPELEATGYILIFAGAETTASALSATVSYLIRHPTKFAKLQEEIRKQFTRPEDITMRSSTALLLPYMHAVLQESLRMAPPVAGHSPRIVPKGGCVIDGEAVPEGVSSCSS